jgi:hypothetical protein
MPCIHTTDPNWIEYLRNNAINNPVFWKRPNLERNLDLIVNDYFYFVERVTRLVVGRGRYNNQIHMTKEVAWERYGNRLGSPTEDRFYTNINSVLGAENELVRIKCIELDEVEWLSRDLLFYFDEATYSRNIQILKLDGFTDEQQRVLNSPLPELLRYYSQDEEFSDILTLAPENDDEQGREDFIEGARRIVTHKSIERNPALITQVKRRRDWTCDICSMKFLDKYNVEYIEAHHKIALNRTGEGITNINQIALLCANCHRAVHKKMVIDANMSYDAIREEIRIRLEIPD